MIPHHIKSKSIGNKSEVAMIYGVESNMYLCLNTDTNTLYGSVSYIHLYYKFHGDKPMYDIGSFFVTSLLFQNERRHSLCWSSVNYSMRSYRMLDAKMLQFIL